MSEKKLLPKKILLVYFCDLMTQLTNPKKLKNSNHDMKG